MHILFIILYTYNNVIVLNYLVSLIGMSIYFSVVIWIFLNAYIPFFSLITLFKVKQALNAITECAKTGEGNLLGLAVEAAKARATVGEITQAMEEVTDS